MSRDVDERLDAYLAARLPLSRTTLSDLIGAGDVRVNGHTERKSYRPRAGDRIDVRVPPPLSNELIPQSIPVDIVHEDEHLLVVDKPAGLVVHPAPGHPDGTLVNALLHTVGTLSSVGLPFRPGIVHRLDKDTSGLMLVAKTDTAHRRLSKALAERQVSRGYLAAAWGHLDPPEQTVDAPIGRGRDRTKMAVTRRGRPAVTHLRRLERWTSADLLAVRLETGRTHQIRVHLRSLGHPIVGDPLYAGGWVRSFGGQGARWARELERLCGRLFLHAARLGFRHPISGEPLSFSSSLPERLRLAAEWAASSD